MFKSMFSAALNAAHNSGVDSLVVRLTEFRSEDATVQASARVKFSYRYNILVIDYCGL